MAANPNPTRISDELWWFIEQLELLEPETVYAGSWGDFKPGYHTDYATSKRHPEWQPDYSIQLPDDQVGNGHPNEKLGAATDWTFPSAQAGNFTNIRKYTDRIRAAWRARDPRLKGWREVLGNSSDGDSGADGYDFVSWTERTPDATHKWHIHFSCLRKYVNVRSVFQAMLSILRGETLAQWQAKLTGGIVKLFKWNKDYWISRDDGKTRETVTGLPDPGGMFSLFVDVYKGSAYPDTDVNGWPATDLAAAPRNWKLEHVDAVFGKQIPFGSSGNQGGGSGGSGVSEARAKEIAQTEISRSTVNPGS